MAKKSQLDLAIESLEAERHVIDHALLKLRDQQRQQHTKKTRKAAPKLVSESAKVG